MAENDDEEIAETIPVIDVSTQTDDPKTVIKTRSKTLALASEFIPEEIREKMIFLYSICSEADYIGDKDEGSPEEKKDRLDNMLKRENVIGFFIDNEIDIKYFAELIEGIKSDLGFKQPENYAELRLYCYRVAGTVGIMSACLFGVKDKQALMKAEQLGVAIQLTNILRDIEEDYHDGRIYIPKDMMTSYGITEEYIENHVFNLGFNLMMAHFETIARYYYDEGNEGLRNIPFKRIRFAIKAASGMYEGILDKIKANGHNPFMGRAHLKKYERLLYVLKSVM